ncbi:MAG: FapA family protein [Paenibacillaceae bacterium]
MKKLDRDSRSQKRDGIGVSSTIGINIDDEVIDGYIQVEHGKIIVVNPSNGGKVPTINAKPPVKLFVDGNEISKETKISSESEFEWRIEEKPLFEISVSEDKLFAYLTINRIQRHAWSLTDKASALDITLTAKEDSTIILETIDLQTILSVIEDMNIKINLDVASVQTEILQPSYRPVKIARGKAPIHGQDAQLDIFFSENIENIFTEVRGLIDYKNHMNIPSVKSGDIIAKKTPPVEGQAGYDVFGNVLLPVPVKDIRIAGKNNVEITPDSIVISRKEGRPRVTGNQVKYFDINDSYIVPGNVDLYTGNIVFAGDVIVHGDVMDKMIIESLGNIYISGSVFNSTLTATGSIAVKGNVIGSNLYSGYFGMLYNRLYNSSKQLTDILEKMMQSTNQLLNELSKKNTQVRYGQVLVLLTESKYQQVGDVAKELLGVISSINNKDALMQLKYYVELFLQPAKMVEIMTAPRMEDFLRILKESFMRVALSQETNVEININQGQKSLFKSNGDILIRKEGVIQCDLYSARNIIFFLDNSVCRGSKLEAGDTISAMYVGGITGVGTSLKAAKKVMVKKMFEGRVIVDRYSTDIFEPVEEMTFDRHSFKQLE